MRIPGLVLIFGLASAGAVLMSPAIIPSGSFEGASQPKAARVLAETSAKMEIVSPRSLDLRLQPDQTAMAEVVVAYPKAVATVPAAAGGRQKPVNPDTKKTRSGVKKRSEPPKKKDEANTNKEIDSEPAVAIKLYLDMVSTSDYPACTASVTSLIGEPSIKPGDSPLKIPISITSCNPKGGDGKLFLSGSKAPAVPVVLRQRRTPQLFATALGSLIAALLICVVCGAIVSVEGHKMRDVMAPVSWDFSASWASNITAFGTAFSFLLSVSVFPDKLLFASKGEYQFVTLFATALAALAPAVYKLASPSTVTNSANGPVVSTAGFVGGFIMASIFTIWGALLQTALELMIVFELARRGAIYLPIVVMLGVCIAFAGILLIVYCWKSLQSIIAANSTRSGPPAAAPRAAFSLAAPNIAMVKERKAAVL